MSHSSMSFDLFSDDLDLLPSQPSCQPAQSLPGPVQPQPGHINASQSRPGAVVFIRSREEILIVRSLGVHCFVEASEHAHHGTPYHWSVLMDQQLYDAADTTFFTAPEMGQTFAVLDSGYDGVRKYAPCVIDPWAKQLENVFWRVQCRGTNRTCVWHRWCVVSRSFPGLKKP